jgi:NitT/TauT family transport system substrate-binding protein
LTRPRQAYQISPEAAETKTWRIPAMAQRSRQLWRMRLATGLAVWLGLACAQAAELKHVIVAKAGNFLAWTLIDLAKAKGLFERQGLDVELVAAQGGPQVLAAVLAGRAQFSTTSVLELIEANSQGQNAKIVSPLIEQSQVACAVRADLAAEFPPASAPWIDRVKALRGRKIGVTSVGGGVSLTLNYMLRGSGMTERDVTETAIGADPAAWVAALRNKQLDAMCAGIPIPEEAIAQGVAQLYVSPALGDVPLLAGIPDATVVTSQSTIDRDPAMVQAFVKGLTDAMKLMHDEPQQAAAVIRQEVFPNMNPRTFDLAFKDFSKAFATTPVITAEQFAKVLEYASFVKGKEIKFQMNDLYDGRFAAAVAK